MEYLSNADFWIGLVKIVWINIILSGDNAVVIAVLVVMVGKLMQSRGEPRQA